MDATKFWQEFSFDYSLEGRPNLSPDLISIEGHRLGAMNLLLAPEWSAQLDKLNRVRAVYGTTALEGNSLSEAEVSHQVELLDSNGTASDESKVTREQLQIRNSARAQAWVKKRFEPGSPPISLDDIMTMHRMITLRSDENHNIPGQLRMFSVQVGSPETGGVHKGAPHEILPRLMEEFTRFVNSDRLMKEHPVIRSLLLHFFLVTIHPFGDGNGRVSRLLEAGILFQGDYNIHGFYGLSNFFYRNKHDYEALLQQSRKTRPFEVTPFIQFGVKGFVNELAGINNFIKTKLNRVVYRQMLVANYNKHIGPRRRLLNEREYQFLTFLLTETEPVDPFSENPSRRIKLSSLSESSWVKIAYKDVTPRTFYRELLRLEDLGFIKFFGGRVPKSLEIELDFKAIAMYSIY